MERSNLTDQILRLLEETNGNYKRVGSKLKLEERYVRKVDMIFNRKFNHTPEGNGKESMKKFCIGKKKVTEPWDNTSAAIAKARKDYDDGLVELLTGRDGEYQLLYVIPRLVKEVDRKPYFSILEVE